MVLQQVMTKIKKQLGTDNSRGCFAEPRSNPSFILHQTAACSLTRRHKRTFQPSHTEWWLKGWDDILEMNNSQYGAVRWKFETSHGSSDDGLHDAPFLDGRFEEKLCKCASNLSGGRCCTLKPLWRFSCREAEAEMLVSKPECTLLSTIVSRKSTGETCRKLIEEMLHPVQEAQCFAHVCTPLKFRTNT